MRIRIALRILCVLVLAPACASALQNQTSTSKTITILQLNDVYQIAPVDRGKRGGLARVGTLLKQIRTGAPNTLFLLAGDFISPSVASRLFKGKQMVAVLNAAGLDIATLGNHEFDFGPEVLRERMKESRFAYTIANVSEKRTGKPFGGASRYIIRDLDGVRVAIFGLLLTETASMSAPGPEVRFEDPVVVARLLTLKLRREGADIIIALTHLPMRDDKRIATEADVDLIVGGHEHEPPRQQENGRAHPLGHRVEGLHGSRPDEEPDRDGQQGMSRSGAGEEDDHPDHRCRGDSHDSGGRAYFGGSPCLVKTCSQ
jgi:5'-nucleotidase